MKAQTDVRTWHCNCLLIHLLSKVRDLANQCCELIRETDPVWSEKIREKRFTIFNRQWLELVMHSTGDVLDDDADHQLNLDPKKLSQFDSTTSHDSSPDQREYDRRFSAANDEFGY